MASSLCAQCGFSRTGVQVPTKTFYASLSAAFFRLVCNHLELQVLFHPSSVLTVYNKPQVLGKLHTKARLHCMCCSCDSPKKNKIMITKRSQGKGPPCYNSTPLLHPILVLQELLMNSSIMAKENKTASSCTTWPEIFPARSATKLSVTKVTPKEMQTEGKAKGIKTQEVPQVIWLP